jgi:hypothetical protein
MEQLEKLEQSAKAFEAKAQKIDSIENEVKAAKEVAGNTAKEVGEVKKTVETVSTEVKSISEWQVKKDEADKKNQEALDQIIAGQKEQKGNKSTKSFSQNFAELVEANWKDISRVSKGEKISFEMKTVGDMSVAANLTGDGTPSHGSQVLLPAQSINLRDLLPTTMSPNRTYIQHREKTTGEGAPTRQTEGNAKSQIDIDFEEIKTVNQYIAGYTRFTKQITKELSFYLTTLPRILLRKFYEAENSIFWTDITTTSGIATSVGSETDDIKVLIDAIAYQINDNYNASYILVNPLQLARLNKALYDSQNYATAAGVVSSAAGTLSVAGVPIISAPWVTDDKGLIIDRDYVERVEVEGLTVSFFEQDADNVTKNMITARIECYEAVNLMAPASARFWDFGNAS